MRASEKSNCSTTHLVYLCLLIKPGIDFAGYLVLYPWSITCAQILAWLILGHMLNSTPVLAVCCLVFSLIQIILTSGSPHCQLALSFKHSIMDAYNFIYFVSFTCDHGIVHVMYSDTPTLAHDCGYIILYKDMIT